jgi:hypothetical protein
MITSPESGNFKRNDGSYNESYVMERDDSWDDSEIFLLRCVNFIKLPSSDDMSPRNHRYNPIRI